MDPSSVLCAIRDTFSPEAEINLQRYLPDPFIARTLPVLNEQIRVSSQVQNLDPDPRLCDVVRYQRLQQRKDRFLDVSEEQYRAARNAANPAEGLGKSIFMDRAAIKCANADAIYHFTGAIPDFINMRIPGPFTFADAAAGPGAFSEYVLWRRPEATGVGMTLTSGDPNLDWRWDRLDPNRMKFLYGDSGTGNLYTEWKAFVREALAMYPEGLDLVMGDGGFNVERYGLNDTTELSPADLQKRRSFNFRRQEFLSQRLLICQFLVGMSLAKVGSGAFFCKIFDSVTWLTAQALYVLSQCFEEVIIFKPWSSRPANAERYLICRRRRANVQTYIDLLSAMNDAYTENEYVVSLLVDIPDPKFIEWLRKQNDISIARQEAAVADIEAVLEGRPMTPKPAYNLHKALIVWNLPDNIPPPREHEPLPDPRRGRPQTRGQSRGGRGRRQ